MFCRWQSSRSGGDERGIEWRDLEEDYVFGGGHPRKRLTVGLATGNYVGVLRDGNPLGFVLRELSCDFLKLQFIDINHSN